MNNTLAFTYDSLSESSSMVVRQRTSEIKSLMRSTAQGIVEIGHKLIEVKEALPHGEFGNWLESEFGWTYRTAYRFINVAENFKIDNLSNLNIAPSALYMLSAPSTPDTAREEAIQRAEQGESISHSTAKEITDNHKPKSLLDNPSDFEPTEDNGYDIPDNVDPDTGEVFDQPTSHVSNNSGNDEWYTPLEYVESARKVMGSIDLDPATTDEINDLIQAKNYFTKHDKGQDWEWHGNVWMNPPYSHPSIEEFITRLIDSDISQAVVLTNNATETRWGNMLLSSCNAVCFHHSRIRFIAMDGTQKDAPLQGQMFTYFGNNKAGFIHEFKQYGVCLEATALETRDTPDNLFASMASNGEPSDQRT